MKFLIAFAFIAVASAASIKPVDVTHGDLGEINEIINAINHPSTDPATAALLQAMLLQTLGISVDSPISAAPAIVQELDQAPISPSPVIVDFPVPDGGAVTGGLEPSPAVVAEIPAAETAPLVQIILNINAPASSADVVPSPAVEASPAVVPTPVIVVDHAPAASEPVMVAEPINPVLVAEPVQPSPVLVAEPVEPVLVANPVLVPMPAVPAPVILN